MSVNLYVLILLIWICINYYLNLSQPKHFAGFKTLVARMGASCQARLILCPRMPQWETELNLNVCMIMQFVLNCKLKSYVKSN